MNVEDIRNYCLAKKAVTESTPFDEVTLVFKVAGKMFCILPLDETSLSITLKCDPELAIQLREQYSCVQPGYHTNKKHWNTISVDGTVSVDKLTGWIDHSYDIVVKGLTCKARAEIGF
jgi:predicted DNA-binding protein (MmcQ/YjbR family)